MICMPLVLKLTGQDHFSELILLCKDEKTEVQNLDAVL